MLLENIVVKLYLDFGINGAGMASMRGNWQQVL
jgi:hypothetical protein